MTSPVVLITGAERGVGRAMALHLAGPGVHLLLHTRRDSGPDSPLQEVAAQASAKGAVCSLLFAELADCVQRDAMLDRVDQITPKLNLLINNVGVFENLPLESITPAQWQHTLDATLSAGFHITQRAAPRLIAAAPAQVINLGDAAADRISAHPRATHYHIAKMGVHLLTRSFAQTLAPHRVRVNMISPGILENSAEIPGLPIPAGRLGGFQDILAALDFLISPAADYITGANIPVSGGWNL
ncbi:MAG: SDR family oxidoreductase [Deltaproteobacteria bacterium]|nr:SDR family oxidoreductase [Deltaproteobacteria bacterium]